jgi:nitrogen fixation/metabolism regulation signal transduction histidine kinase
VKLKTRLWIYLTVLHLLGFSAVVYYREHLGWWFLVLEALLAVSFVVGARLIKNALEPLDFVRAFSDVVDSGEYNARYSTIGQLDMDGLIETFNVMLSQLQAERLRLGEQRGFLERFLSVTPIGILILDFDGRVRVANPAAAAFLEAAGDQLMEQRLAELENPLGKRLAGLENNQAIMITDAEGRRLRCLRSEFFDRGFGRSYYTIEELTEEVQRSERSAYEKLIRMISHEVNNTVAATNSLLQSNLRYANELAQDEGAQFRESLEVVITRNSHLNEFTRGFANLVRLPEPERRPEKVRDLVDAVQAIFLPEFERRAIELEVDVSPELPQVSLDRNQMEQVLINVVKNAVESIDREGRIAISASRERGEVVLRVIDDGAGLSDESRENLFSPFYTSKEQGQGLGLTLVKEILTQHRFRYSLQSQGPLTEFRIQMPTG